MHKVSNLNGRFYLNDYILMVSAGQQGRFGGGVIYLSPAEFEAVTSGDQVATDRTWNEIGAHDAKRHAA